jgi:hypothetical protein
MIVYTCRKQFSLELSPVTTKDKVVFCCERDIVGHFIPAGNKRPGLQEGGIEHLQSPRYQSRSKERREKLQTSCLT